MNAVKLSASCGSGDNSPWRIERLHIVAKHARRYLPNLLALHDHKGTITAYWRPAQTKDDERRLAWFFETYGDGDVFEYFQRQNDGDKDDAPAEYEYVEPLRPPRSRLYTKVFAQLDGLNAHGILNKLVTVTGTNSYLAAPGGAFVSEVLILWAEDPDASERALLDLMVERVAGSPVATRHIVLDDVQDLRE